MTNSQLPHGVFAAALTPQRKDFIVDYEAFIGHCQWLLANGCNGIAVFGTTGEANSFSVKERLELLDRLGESGIPPNRLLVGTGCCAIPDTVELTRHAVAHGVGGVLMLPPFYYKQISDDGLFATFDYIIQQISDGHLKIYLYHFPKMTGVPFSNAVVERLIRTYPDTVVGMKDSSGDWEHMKFLCEHFPGFNMYAGTEKFLLDILNIGGVGCISASTNVTCRIAGDVFTAWQHREHEAAEKFQKQLTELRLMLEQYPFIPGLKHIMANFTGQEKWLNMRPPNVLLKNQETRDLEKNLESLNFIKTIFTPSA